MATFIRSIVAQSQATDPKLQIATVGRSWTTECIVSRQQHKRFIELLLLKWIADNAEKASLIFFHWNKNKNELFLYIFFVFQPILNGNCCNQFIFFEFELIVIHFGLSWGEKNGFFFLSFFFFIEIFVVHSEDNLGGENLWKKPRETL